MPYSDLSTDHDKFDLAPWTDTPSSSRVSRFRYDHANKATQVQWRNGANHGYIYGDMNYEEFRMFARAVSKGKKVNTFLNGKPYRLMDTDEVAAGSNTGRRGLTSRVRG